MAVNGRAGLLLELDVRRFGFARRPRPEERHGLYYTKAALLDGYELLRQLVDNTDELAHCCVVVIAGPEFTADPNRGVDAYQALKLRIADEVRDRNRDNPYSSLVRACGDARERPGRSSTWRAQRPRGRSRRCAPACPTATRWRRSARSRPRSRTASASCSMPSASPAGR